MADNPLRELAAFGQSIWYDQMRRALFTSGELQRLIDEDDLRGVTSNPTIFEKAIGGSTDYDDALEALAIEGKSVDEIYESLAIDDIGRAADLLRPVYERTNGVDGYVSLEVSPTLAHDTERTVSEAKRLFAALARPNVMIKVPATPEGIPAIEELIAAGLNINVTLIFAQSAYEDVANAYIRGLERRAAQGLPVNSIASVASFFVSRIDTAVDAELGVRARRATSESERERLTSLLGTIAIANAKIAYQKFKELFEGERFAPLRAWGARVQRPLWASTGTKNPEYRDVVYIETLIGPDTVNTVPPPTLAAFRDHGIAASTIENDVLEARGRLALLEELGISLDAVTAQLVTEGVASFAKSFETLMDVVEKRRSAVIGSVLGNQSAQLGAYQSDVDAVLRTAAEERWTTRIWDHDAALWKSEADHQSIIRNALGWLAVVETMRSNVAELVAFADRVRADGFEHVAVLGMGGSSLCPEVLRQSFGKRNGFPELHVLDSTVPAAVSALEARIDVAKTIFVVASKSGSTTEPRMFHRYFYSKVRAVKGERAGENFVAVTDPNTKLGDEAARDNFRRVFVNPADIGGRYSALSYFGMVPAALAGIDVGALLERGYRAASACAAVVPVDQNPGARLGAMLGALAAHGRDKLTLVIAPPVDSLGLWIEQLVAESTGKNGLGIVPIAGEALGTPVDYGDDRVFVSIATRGNEEANSAALDALAAAGHPVIRLAMTDTLGLGAQFFLWEFATAIAGKVLGINPFDQPNVQESKDNTVRILAEYESTRAIETQDEIARGGDLVIYGYPAVRDALGGESATLESVVAAHLASVKPGDYVAFTQYFAETESHDALVDRIRLAVCDGLKVATTTGYGPRFLHSTGQLHKGGGDDGVFVQLTCDHPKDLAIEGETFTFGVLAQAQALGDYKSLATRNRRAIRFHLGSDVGAGLERLLALVEAALATRGKAAL